MSDDETGDLPSAAECDKRCKEFATITGTDTALAMFYLQDRDWDLQRSLNSFFNEPSKSSEASSLISVNTASSSEAPPDDEPYRVRLMSWNIDGLDQQNLRSRTLGVVDEIKKMKPHVVFLQEVVPASEEILSDALPTYHILPGNNEGYYTAMMFQTGVVEVQNSKLIEYPNTMMMRNLLSVECLVKGEKFHFLTSHLESTKEHAKERKNQLKIAFDKMSKQDNSWTSIFGGDLNLRDPEVVAVGGMPEGVYDVWEITGKRPEAKFTWDTQRNDNLEWGGKFKPKCRFDRLYMKPSEPKKVKAEYFELVGLERLKSCQRFCSDHWGLLVHFNILSKLPK